MLSLLWFACGALLGFGVVGFFTGLVLVPFGIALLVHLWNRRVPGWWLVLVGAGTGPVALFWGDVVGHPEAPCKVISGGYACRASGAVPGFVAGSALIAAGVLLGLMTTYITRRSVPSR